MPDAFNIYWNREQHPEHSSFTVTSIDGTPFGIEVHKPSLNITRMHVLPWEPDTELNSGDTIRVLFYDQGLPRSSADFRFMVEHSQRRRFGGRVRIPHRR